jgi:hypothetical protein
MEKNNRSLFGTEEVGEKEGKEIMIDYFGIKGDFDLINLAFKVAERESDGHFAILKLKQSYSVGLGSFSFLDGGSKVYSGGTLREALLNFLYNEV